ncbi:hypothetical protein BK649P1_00019 [Bacteroides phage BK649P1]|jgi:hypothetical protein|nr:hypothetical protein BF486P1_00023 [Bacteroides phage BF486P1]WAX07583.1 hypothetical protein BK649P1_00019 [Bacteroides phage BK649P1]
MKKINKLAIDSVINLLSTDICKYCYVSEALSDFTVFCEYSYCVKAAKKSIIRKNIKIGMDQRYLHYENKLKYILVDGGEKISTEATKKQNKWYKSLSYIRWYKKIK